MTQLHREDLKWPSANIMLAGEPKIWLAIKPDSMEKFIEKVDQEYGLQECSQGISHLETIYSPDVLDSWNIGYTITLCGPGQMIFTAAGTLHQVSDMGQNLAEATNFVFSDTTIIPNGYIFCSKELCDTDR